MIALELLRWPIATLFCVASICGAGLVLAHWWIPPLKRVKYEELVREHNELAVKFNELHNEVVSLNNRFDIGKRR